MKSKKVKKKVEQGLVPVNKLVIDGRYQRPLSESRVKKMVANFNERLLGTIEVSARPDGTFANFDGQHRGELAERMGITHLRANIHYGLSSEDEATLFVSTQQSRKNVSPAETFKANVFSGDAESITINKIIEGTGFCALDAPGSDNIRAVVTVISAYRKHGADNLRGTLNLIRELWHGEKKALDASFISAVSEFYADFGHKLTPKAKENLSVYNPIKYLRRADVEGMGGAGNVKYRVAEELRKASKLRRPK